MRLVLDGFMRIVLDEFGLLALFPVLLGLPCFIVTELIYIIMSVLRNRGVMPMLAFPLIDVLIVIGAIQIWSVVYPFGVLCKSFTNLIETGLLTMLACVFYAIRCYHAFKGNEEKMKRWQWLSFAILPIVAVLSALLFPTLPE